SLDSSYAVGDGELLYASELYAEIEINRRGEELCDAELVELQERIEGSHGPHTNRVLAALGAVTAMVAVRVLWQGRDAEATLEKIDPLWKWLFANRRGLMQADGEGYYESTGLILSVK